MIVIDENGNEIDLLAQRNEEIKQKLKPVLDEFLAEKKVLMSYRKPMNLGYRFSKQLMYVMSSYGQMSAENVAKLDYETINDFWLKYLDITAYYNRYFDIVDNKQMFQVFMGINNRIYTQLERHQDEDIRNLMQTINDSFIGLGFTASESGNAQPASVKQRLGAKEAGHNVVSATDDLLADKLSQQPTQQEIERRVKAILGDDIKMIGGKK